MPILRTIAAPARLEIEKIRGSRFLADAAPAGTAEEAEAVLAAVRSEFPGATHHCSAWRIDDDAWRADDDGEPGGSAGQPILRQIDGHGLARTVVVVTRWFGGTKLGTGGLIRAYGAAAKAVLEIADVTEASVRTRLRLGFPYELTGAVGGVLAAHGAETIASDFQMAVRLEVAIEVERLEAFRAELDERTARRVRLDVLG